MTASIFYYEINDDLSEEEQSKLIDLWIKEIPAEKKIKIQNLRLKKDQLLSLAGLKLLQLGVSKLSNSEFSLSQLHFPFQKKPFVKEDIDFNISHSGKVVCCAISEDLNIGIDIELQRDVSTATMTKFLSENNWGSDESNKQRFFKLWTIYESIIKAANHGSIFNIENIVLEEEKGIYQEKNWYFYPINIKNKESDKKYTCHIACSEKTDKINIQKIIKL